MRLLHVADLHLGWEAKYLDSEKARVRKQERNEVLRHAVDLALDPKHRIDGVLLVGDLFETYDPEKGLVRDVIEQLERLVKEGLFLLTVPGNHDEITYPNSVYRRYRNEWPGVLVSNPMPEEAKTYIVNGEKLHIYSLAYTGGMTNVKKLRLTPRKEEEGFHLGAFHGTLDWDGLSDRSLPLSSEQLNAAGYDYIALGHIHQAAIHRLKKSLAVYPGALEAKSFHDLGCREFTICQWQDHKVSVEKIPYQGRCFESIQIDVSSMKDEEELRLRCLRYADVEKALKFTFIGTPRFSLHVEELQSELDRYFFYVEVDNEVQYFTSDFLKKIEEEVTLRGLFVCRMKKRIESAVDPKEIKILELALLKGLAVMEDQGE